MALSAKPFFTCGLTPFPQKHSSKTVNLTHTKLMSTIPPQKWSISQENTLASSPSNHFIYQPDEQSTIQDEFCIRHEKKLRAFKHMLSIGCEDAAQSLAMIDAIQRLAIDYHFQEEIDEILQRHHTTISSSDGSNLQEVALEFRLLRQEGYYVPAGVFDNFKDKGGKFKQEVMNDDINGLMELYEASQLSIEGEDILDEARDYSYNLLNSWIKRLNYPQAKAVENTLYFPYHKSLARFMAKDFNRYFEGENVWMNELQELAKLDIKMVQYRHQQEIVQISRWWKDLGIYKELKFARNQPLKWYVWSMATLADPNFVDQRIDLTKPISFIYIIDDIFDVHGTLDELTLFTQVIDRWDVNASKELPDYMKICFNALDKVTNEISDKIYRKHGRNPVDSLRKTWAVLCKAFLVEAGWSASGQIPNTEEYLENGIVSSGVHVVLVHIYFLLGLGVTRESVDFINNNPAIGSSTAAVLRLWDDLGSAKDEGQKGHDGSYVECYMKEYEGSSAENARNQVFQLISDSWKQLNQEFLFPHPFSSSSIYRKSCLSLARMVPLMYSYDDNQRLPVLEQHLKSLFSTETYN